LKICSSCAIEKNKAEFHKVKANKDGLSGQCCSCIGEKKRIWYANNAEKERARSKAWSEANPDKVAATRKKYNQENPERVSEIRKASAERNKDRRLACGRAWYAKNSEKKIAYSKEWYEKNIDHARAAANVRSKSRYHANPELMSERAKEYRKKNPDGVAAQKRRYKASKLGAEGSHTGKDVQAIFDSQRGLCANCKKKLFKSGENKFHVDHIAPLSKGGSNWPSNLQCLCPSCNLRKSAKDPLDWAKENGRLL
jgi:5-methylcytosine-specific restriction endonuclease McrA